jgi:aldose 1-epimerase
MSLSGARHEITAGGYRAAVADVGAGLAGLWFDGVAITVDYPPEALPPKSAGAVLLPWPNRIRDGKYSFDGVDYQLPLSEPALLNASHGLVRWERWTVVAQDDSSVTMALDLVPQTGYPFELSMQLRYTVSADSGLTVATTVQNVGGVAAPFGAGFHPYIDLADRDLDHAELAVPAATMLVVDDRMLPVDRASVVGTPYDLRQMRPLGTLRLDHAFVDLTGRAASVRSADRLTEVWWDDAFRCVQVFTIADLTPGRSGIAIEPMTCPANAFNSAELLIRLEPGDSWAGTWGIAVR